MDEAAGSSINQEGSNKTSSHSEESMLTSAVKDESSEEDSNLLSADSNSQEGIGQEKKEEGESNVVEAEVTQQSSSKLITFINKDETINEQNSEKIVQISVIKEYCRDQKSESEDKQDLQCPEFICRGIDKQSQDISVELDTCDSEEKSTVAKLEVCDSDENPSDLKLKVRDSEDNLAIFEEYKDIADGFICTDSKPGAI